ncbi:MAG: hypothetical protein DRI44_02820 [Chlamydiae bacterium]|nr:MAG: hypothetical protein DRI44_02820 [Chlamydiota bacterium]
MGFLIFMKLLRLVIISSIFIAISLNAKSKYPIGEKLEFKAYALGFIPIGKVWMDVGTGSFNNIPTYQFHARCYGDYKVYLADVRVSSDLSKKTDKSLFHSIEQFGTERRGRHLYFDWASDKLHYVRLEKDGKYRLRRTVPITPDVWDIFGCAFRTRRLLKTELGAYTDVKLIEKTKIYHLRFTVVERRPFEVKGVGIFDAARIKMSALNLKPKEIFKGLLNLDKDVTLWIDVSTKTPLFISTKVPFGFFKPTIKVVMKKWDTVPGFEPTFLPHSALHKK